MESENEELSTGPCVFCGGDRHLMVTSYVGPRHKNAFDCIEALAERIAKLEPPDAD